MSPSSGDISRLIEKARSYVADRSDRDARRALEQLRRLDDVVLTDAVETLRTSTDPLDRGLALLLIPEHAGPEGLDQLISILDGERDPRVVAAAVEALRAFDAPTEELDGLADYDDPTVRRAVAVNLYGKSDPRAFDLLLRLGEDSDPEVRDWAVWALADSFESSPQRDTALRHWLTTAPTQSQLTGHVRQAVADTSPVPEKRTRDQPAVRKESKKSAQLKVLITSANPLETGRLELDEEFRDISHALRETPARNSVELVTALALRTTDLVVELNEHAPSVLHFSGHGTPDGRLVFAGRDEAAQQVDAPGLAGLLGAAGESVRVVLLNACFSAALAESLVDHVDLVVGMNRPIEDRAARLFAKTFYSSLGYGSSVGRAFDQGVAIIQAQGFGESKPELLARPGVDPHELALVEPPSTIRYDPSQDQRILRELTAEHLSLLAKHARLPIGEGLEIQREVAGPLLVRALEGSMFILGPPGVGKTGALHRLAVDLQSAGHDVVVLAADLLGAAGGQGLGEELGLQRDLYRALSAWQGDSPGFLLIDALDAARGRESSAELMSLVARVAIASRRWQVIASIRSFDLRHNPDLREAIPAPSSNDQGLVDPEFSDVQHLAVGALRSPEIQSVADVAPVLSAFLAEASEPVRELVRVPFNLTLLIRLLQREGSTEKLRSLRTQLELLDLYWDARVQRRSLGRDDRVRAARSLCELSVEHMRLQVPRSDLVRNSETSAVVDELLSEGVLIEGRSPSVGGIERVAFSHQVLYDYAVHRTLLSGKPDELISTLTLSEDLVLLARPSLGFRLLSEWEADSTRERFWGLAVRLSSEEIPAMARLVAPAVAVENATRLEDFGPLLSAIDLEDEGAFFVLRHVVGAVAATGESTRPLVHADLAVWTALAEALAERISPASAYATRILIWGLSVEIDRLTDAEFAALGRAARLFLRWALEHAVPAPMDVQVAIEAVARTCRSDPGAATGVLRTLLEPIRLSNSGYRDLRPIADEIGSLVGCMPEFVGDVYATAFGREETSEELTPMGTSQIMALTSTRRQDWEMIRYTLVQSYPELLSADQVVAMNALTSACLSEAQRGATDRPARIERFDFLGHETGLLPDHSEIWDTGDERGNDAVGMLNAFQEHLVEMGEAANQHALIETVRVIAQEPRPAGVWRRVFRAAAAVPGALAPLLGGVCASPVVLASPALREPIGEFLRLAPEYWDDPTRSAVENAILSLPDEVGDRGEMIRDRLMGCLPLELIRTEAAVERRQELERAGGPPPNAPPFSFRMSAGEVDVDEELRERGIDPTAEANREVLRLIGPVEQFVKEHTNVAPTTEEAHVALPAIQQLRATRADLTDALDEPLNHDAVAWLSEAAAALAWQTPLPVDDETVEIAKSLAIEGSRGAIPRPAETEPADSGGGTMSWGVPSGRIDAARALLLLAREPRVLDDDEFEAITRLAEDPVPAVRWNVARFLWMAHTARPDRVWNLVEERAADEPTAAVREALVHSLAPLLPADQPRAISVALSMYNAELAREGSRESLLRTLSGFLVDAWVWRGDIAGRQVVDSWIKDIDHRAELGVHALHRLREAVIHGSSEAGHVRIRQRAFAVWSDLTAAARDVLNARLERELVEGSSEQQDRETMRQLARLLDTSASEVYFSSGAYAERSKDAEDRLSHDLRIRFYKEASVLFEILLKVGIPAVAHHLLETFATYVDDDPRGVFLRVAQVLEAGKSWGYQLESLAESEFVSLVERYLASYRDLFLRDSQLRAALLASTESFVDAGSLAARRLLYGLDDMFR
jgi:hypothetical protein